MVNLVWKDIIILKRFLWLAPLYGSFALFFFRTIPGGALSAGTVMVTYMLVLQAITLDDKSHSEIMLNSLPIRRMDIVFAKYLSVFLYAAVVIMFYLLAQTVVTVMGISISITKISLEGIAGALIAMALLISVYFPIYFKFGYLRSRIVGTILFVVSLFLFPMGITLVHGVGGMNNPIFQRFVASLHRVIGWLQTQTDWQIASYLLVLALIFTAASALLSLRFYTRREF